MVNSGHAAANNATVTTGFTRAVLQLAQRMNVQLGLVENINSLDRIPLAVQDDLWEHLCSGTRDPLIGVELGLGIQVEHLDAVGMVLMTSETIGDAIDLLVDYQPVVSEGGAFEFCSSAGKAELVYHPYHTIRRAPRTEAALACLLNMARWTTGDAFEPTLVSFSHSPLAEPARYSDLLETKVAFGANANALQFPSAALDLPLVHANPQLCRHLRTMVDDLLARLDDHSLSAQVRSKLREHPRWGRDRIADELNLSGRHLVRKLNREGASFKLLRETLLQEMAEQRLRYNAQTAVLAEELGYADESAFIKAFRRWVGVTPAQFRAGNREARPDE